jgi:hypothetical protein
MQRYYFHCTDGTHLVLDRRGRVLSGTDEVTATAESAATRLMRRLPRYPRWSEWLVCVHDEAGEQVLVLPFLDDEEEAVGAVPPAREIGCAQYA